MSGLLGGNAGKIDTDALIKALMQAKTVPQDQLKDQLKAQQNITSNYQELNSRLQSLADAAGTVADADSWSVTKAASSNPAVVASSTAAAGAGASTFTVTALAAAQVSTVAADANGDVVTNPTAGIDLTVGGTAHHIDVDSASAADVATAIDKADIGVRAAVINVDDGSGGTTPILQLSAARTGTDNAFSADGFDSAANTIVDAADARISVGGDADGAYTISSQSNTFTDAMPGVTFSVSAGALDQNVTISVSDDVDTISSQVKAMVDAANSVKGGIGKVTGKGGVLQGHSDIRSIGMDLGSAISMGTAEGKSLTEYGIDMDNKGVISFDAATFASAYAADAKGTMAAVSGSLAASFCDTARTASAPITGSLSQTITAAKGHADDLSTQIDKWNDRLDRIHDRLVTKYTAMQTALAKLQSQGDWLTSMFKSMQKGDDNN
jgi:flagellar hook-associated protein 2